MQDIEKYLPKALEMEIAFLKSRNPQEIDSFSKDHHAYGDGAYIVPSEVMFQKDEKILIKAPVSDYLLEKYGAGASMPTSPASRRKKPFFHRHEFFEFNYVYQGKVENYLGREKLIQEQGQILLMNPYAAHYAALGQPDTIYFNILVNRAWAEEIFSSLLSFQKNIFNFFLDSVYGLNRVSPYIVFENTPELDRLFGEMIKEYYEDAVYSQQMLFSKLFELFIILSRQMDCAAQKKPDDFEKSRLLSELLSYLRLHYADASLEETAEHFGYTAAYLSRLIKKETGKHFSEILQEYKLKSACNYLANSGLSTEKISEIVGYNDASYFSKVFQKKMGMTPREYRRTHR